MSDQKFALPDESPANLIGGPAHPEDKRWWLRGVRRAIAEAGAQIFHGTNFEVPYVGNTPSILTIHDLSPWRDPAWHSGASIAVAHAERPGLIRLKRARMILTVSDAIRQEIMSRFLRCRQIVCAIPLADYRSGFVRYWLTPRKKKPEHFLFMVFTLEPRKNLPALVEARRATRAETGADLCQIAGRTRADFAYPFRRRKVSNFAG